MQPLRAGGVLFQANLLPSTPLSHGQSPPDSCHSPLSTQSYFSPFFRTPPLKFRDQCLARRSTSCRVQGRGLIRAYTEPSDSGPVAKFFKNLQGSLPIIGLLSRLVSEEGGVGTDRLRYGEFCRRVDKGITAEVEEAFADFQARHGKMARKQVVLLWAWATAVGAGLVKSEDIMLGARRLRYSYDTEYEIDVLDMVMDESLKKRAKVKGKFPDIPMAARAQKALEAVCACCIGSISYPPEDVPLLLNIFTTLFPSVGREEILAIIEERVEIPAMEPTQAGSEDELEGSPSKDSEKMV